MTTNETDAKTAVDRRRLIQPKNMKSSDEKASSLPKWFEDSRNIHEHQVKYLDKIYEMREKLIRDEGHLHENSSTRADRQKYLATRPLRGRPRAFTSPSLLDDVKGILISRRSDVRGSQAHSDSDNSSKVAQVGLRGKTAKTKDEGSFRRRAGDIPRQVPWASDDEVFLKMTKCVRGRPCEGAPKCHFCRREFPIFEAISEKKERKGFCTAQAEDKSKSGTTKRRETKKDSTSSVKKIQGSQKEKVKNKKERFSKLPKLKEIPRRQRYEIKQKGKKPPTSQSSSSCTDGVGIDGKQTPLQENFDKADELFSKLELLDAQLTKTSSPTSISPRSISPFSISDTSENSPSSPSHVFKFPETDPSSIPKVSINLPPVPWNASHVTTSSHFSLPTSNSVVSDDDEKAPVIVLRPATPYIEKTDQMSKSQKRGWSLWKAVKQTEVRRMELRKLIDDIREFNTNNKTIEKRISEVSTS